MSNIDYEESLENFISLKIDSLLKLSINEATTRFRVIDSIIRGLGWCDDDIVCEERFNGKYTDYTLSINNNRRVIVEAKKSGIDFEIPISKYEKTIYRIDSIIKNNDKLKKAIEQVSSYCQERGVEVGVITNGHQFVAFIANRIDGVSPINGNCIVFSSPKRIVNNYIQFWNFLSKEGVSEKLLKAKLLGSIGKVLPPKLSTKIIGYPGIKNRNPFQTDMQIVSELVLQDTLKANDKVEQMFLEECYCKTGAISDYGLLSKTILQERYQNIFEKDQQVAKIIPVSDKKGLSVELKQSFSAKFIKRPIMLIGDVGAGKSTFINYLTKVEAREVFDEAYTFIIDLGSQAILSKDIKSKVISLIRDQLENIYNIDVDDDKLVRQVYASEIEKFRKGIYRPLFESKSDKATEKEISLLSDLMSDQATHIMRTLNYIGSRNRKQSIIFLDNCDQRNDADQQEVFLISQEIAEHWPCTVFVSLRPETFYKSVNKGALSGYHPKVFTISPPRVDQVLEKRFAFARKIAKGEIPIDTLKGLKIELSNLDLLLEVVEVSLKNNRDVLTLLENISNSNIRLIIQLVMKFLGSGHVDTDKIIRIRKESGYYLIPIHEFLRAIVYLDTIHYNPSSISPITNIFDISTYDQKEHFIKIIILSLLHKIVTNRDSQGFMATSKLSDTLQDLGYYPHQIHDNIAILKDKKLIEMSSKDSELNSDNMPSGMRITPTGEYHIVYLLEQFAYVDAMIVDIPILDAEINEKIVNVFPINDRLDRMKIFIEYLDKCWEQILTLNSTIPYDWHTTKSSLEHSMADIQHKIVKKEN